MCNILDMKPNDLEKECCHGPTAAEDTGDGAETVLSIVPEVHHRVMDYNLS